MLSAFFLFWMISSCWSRNSERLSERVTSYWLICGSGALSCMKVMNWFWKGVMRCWRDVDLPPSTFAVWKVSPQNSFSCCGYCSFSSVISLSDYWLALSFLSSGFLYKCLISSDSLMFCISKSRFLSCVLEISLLLSLLSMLFPLWRS